MKKVMGLTSCILGFILVVFGIVMKVNEDTAVSIIGGTDGPTAVFYAGKLNGDLISLVIFTGVMLLAIAMIVFLKRKR